ncbi:MAG: hypothetical protein KF864_13465 [Phycisphaeraceae bacterium]|nr:hypothetical protein [Phycisphaeraceae bacterium]
MNGQPARALTPFAFLRNDITLRDAAVLCISAGGSNPDILAAFQHAIVREPASLTVLCGRPEAPLLRRAARAPWVHQSVVQHPTADGFLATHSTVAFAVQIFKTIVTSRSGAALPATLPGLFGQRTWPAVRKRLGVLTAPLWASRTFVVLHGPTLEAAAFDIESRFTEAALGHVQLSDHRNFGHGRHHWLAKMAQESAVLSLATEEDAVLARQTLELIPQSIPRASLLIHGGEPHCVFAALVASIVLPESLGPIRKIDPAKPGVPLFGRKLYRLGALRRHASTPGTVVPAAIERKIGATGQTRDVHGSLAFWTDAHRRYVERLALARFDAVVLDFDGTLCEVHARYDNLGPQIVADLVRLLRRDVAVVVATGRGNSALEGLRLAIGRTLWPKMIVALNNGSRIYRLDSDVPLLELAQPPGLSDVWDVMNSDRLLNDVAKVHTGGCTVSIRPKPTSSLSEIANRVRMLVHGAALPLCVRESTHSIDVAPFGVSKRLIVDFLRDQHGRSEPLAIGDRGDPSGNDFDLLHSCLSLSVDRVSSAPDHCWHLAPAGLRFVTATRHYLAAIRPGRDGTFRLRLPELPQSSNRLTSLGAHSPPRAAP